MTGHADNSCLFDAAIKALSWITRQFYAGFEDVN